MRSLFFDQTAKTGKTPFHHGGEYALLQHILYLAAPDQVAETRKALHRLGAVHQKDQPSLTECHKLHHNVLQGLTLKIYLLQDIDGVTPHLKQFPVDLLIYDERGDTSVNAYESLRKIQADVLAFAQLWGPDFLFPMSRCVAILKDDASEPRRAFELGRIQLRDVYVGSGSTASILRWLRQILQQGIIRENKVGVALSGGGLDGLLYHMGCIQALERALNGRTLYGADAYSGISSGSIMAAALAHDISVLEMIKAMHKQSHVLPDIGSSSIFQLAGTGIMRRVLDGVLHSSGRLSPAHWIKETMRSVPTGFFRVEKIEELVKDIFARLGKLDSFQGHGPKLYIGATDQDSFEHVVFGGKGWDDIPVSQAVSASCAFPPIFTPANIHERMFIDGQVTKTCNPEVLAMQGCRLIFILDPVQPFATHVAGSVDQEGGVHATIQVIKALVYSRFHQTLTHLNERYPDVDFIVFQPDEKLAELMSGSPMRYRFRTEIIAQAFRGTLRRLRERHHVYDDTLSKYGFKLKTKKQLLAIEREERDIL